MDVWTWEHFCNLADGYKLSLLMALIFANLATGIAVGFYTGTFRFKMVGDFLLKRLLPFVLGYGAVVAVAMTDDTWKTAIVAIWGIIIATLVGAIYENLKELGLPLPNLPGFPSSTSTPPTPPR
ncbi:MAG: phage holin family protein [Dehalococcoidales bacterium]|nr:phage holin family protein [Dehalococcoidales bacterium]